MDGQEILELLDGELRNFLKEDADDFVRYLIGNNLDVIEEYLEQLDIDKQQLIEYMGLDDVPENKI